MPQLPTGRDPPFASAGRPATAGETLLWLAGSPKQLVQHRGFRVFLLTLIGQAFAFGTSVLLARILHSDGYGRYLYATSWALLIAQVSVLGFDRLAVREVAAARARHKRSSVRALVRFLFRWAMVASMFGVAVALSIAIGVAAWMKTEFPTGIILAILTTPLMVALAVQAGVIRGADQIVGSQLPDKLVRPLVFAVLLVSGLLVFGWKSVEAVIVLGGIASLVTIFWTWRPTIRAIGPPDESVLEEFDPRVLLQSAGQLGITMVIQAASTRLDPLLVGSLAGMQQLALFMVAIRLSQIVVLMLSVFNVLLGPNIARLHALNQRAALQRTLRKFAWAIMVSALGIAVPICIFHREILLVLGKEFVAAGPALIILCAGQIISAAAGPAGSVLVYCGREADAAKMVFISSVVGAVTSVALIPSLGAKGAAIAVSLGLAVKSAGFTMLCWKRLRVDASMLGRSLV